MRLSWVALLLLFAPAGSAAASTAPPDTFIVELERDDPRTAIKVVPRSDGTVVLTLTDGTIEYHHATHIRAIRASDRTDLTAWVLTDHEPLGTGHAPEKLERARVPERYRSFRLRPGPPSVCGAYMITESAIMLRQGPGGDGYALLEYGYARNVGRSYSLGATGFAGSNPDWSQVGLRLRLVEWPSPNVSVHLAPGILTAGGHTSGTTDFVAPQLAAQAGVTVNGRFGWAVEVFSVHMRDNNVIGPPVDIRETRWHVGLRFGGEAGIVATIPTFLLGGIMQTTE